MSTVRSAEHKTRQARSKPAQGSRRFLRGPSLRVLVTTVVLVPIALIWAYPFLWMVTASLKSNPEFFRGLNLLPEVPQWQNYPRAWQEAHIGQYFLNTVYITAASITITIALTSAIGYVLGRYSFPGKKIIIGLFVATVFLPQGYTVIPVFDIVNRLGLANSLWGVILAESGSAHVIQILLFSGYFSRFPRELEEAAILDGASFPRVFFQVMLPLATPMVASSIIMNMNQLWNSFLLPLVLTMSRPDLRTLAVGMYAFRGEFQIDWGGMAAAASISILPIIFVFFFLQRYFVEGIAGAIK